MIKTRKQKKQLEKDLREAQQLYKEKFDSIQITDFDEVENELAPYLDKINLLKKELNEIN